MNRWYLKIRDMLELMTSRNASDLHITVGMPPYIRIDGEILATDLPSISQEECELMLFSLLDEEQAALFKKTKVLDFSYGESGLGRFRFNIYKQRGTIAAAIRRHQQQIPDIEDLGLPADVIFSLCRRNSGLILVAGPVGCGKTTSLAAMTKYINQTRKCHIISIEDPIEYVHESQNSLIHQREIHTDALSFADSLKYSLREDPDVIIIGEMRDLDTIASAVTIAETGHLVMATLHTSNAGESISRIVDVFPAQQQAQVRAQLSTSLLAVINQLLIPTKDNTGRVLAAELMITNPAISSLIRESKFESIYSHIQMGSKYGMTTMNSSLCELVRMDKIESSMAMSKSNRPKELERLLNEAL